LDTIPYKLDFIYSRRIAKARSKDVLREEELESMLVLT